MNNTAARVRYPLSPLTPRIIGGFGLSLMLLFIYGSIRSGDIRQVS